MLRRRLLIFLSLGFALGCGEDCPRSLVIRASYAGTATGVHYNREITPRGQVIASAGGGPSITGPVASAVSSRSCWDSTAPADETGWKYQYWIDLDGEDQAVCVADRALLDLSKCGPDPGEPQIVQEFTIRRSGTTEINVVLTD